MLLANGDSGMQLGDVSKEELADISTGIGEIAGTEAALKNGVLCGRGDMSMESSAGNGEEASIGGVRHASDRGQSQNMLCNGFSILPYSMYHWTSKGKEIGVESEGGDYRLLVNDSR